jgi:NDP-sugar pyrophosphorylase family protein/aminoglycoside/choline kinase family phosphotransferase
MDLSVFILAAGLGERLRPITNHIPKPLLPVLGKPILESVIEKVSALPLTALGVNLHYKKEEIEQWISQSAFNNKVTLFPENPVLGTGGALKNAQEFLKNGLFLVHNADILSDVDLEKLIAFHKQSGNLATLAVHDFPQFNNLVIDDHGYLIELGALCSLCRAPNAPLLAFTGIAVYAPEFLSFLPEGASSVVHAWITAISSGQKIGTYDVTGCSWTDIGTPASYAKAVINGLRSNGNMVYIHPSVESCKNVEMDGYMVIEKGSILSKGLSFRTCIILPGTEIRAENREDTGPECFLTLFWGKGRQENPYNPRGDAESKSFENCIIGPDFTVVLKESDLFDISDHNAVLIGTGGSDRSYYRSKKSGRSVVLMQCPEMDSDYERHIAYTLFFRKYSLPVPELIESGPYRKSAYFEDLGDLSLFSWLQCHRGPDELEEMYKKILDMLILLHTTVTDHVSDCPLLESRVFDYRHLRWETSYFVENFIGRIKGIELNDGSALHEEFHRLAARTDSFHKTLVHRDFQSQNIMITKGNVPRLIDYQGARIGPPAYDVASVLWDPYYRLEESLRERILRYYIIRMAESARWFNEKDFRKSLIFCRLQRHMQALGAFGFLSEVKGKKYFLNHIPEGLRLLSEDLSEIKEQYPALDELVKRV